MDFIDHFYSNSFGFIGTLGYLWLSGRVVDRQVLGGSHIEQVDNEDFGSRWCVEV